ncbi:hypothetical protein bcgnr5378_06010 [Bacillus cereus]|uniref:Rpn family recombination-promoting nuclease/putative transposase n=1 Tax=Bacillus cereus TaxID=1396 RepID=A0A164LB92_BACCE|nr:hypothetical protein [Bacillus cereus]KZD55627.1 hypothetical protein B4088_5372 [Bacillus cereus]
MSNNHSEEQNEQQNSRTNHDNIFKNLLKNFFKEYLQFTQPTVYDEIDISHTETKSENVSLLQTMKGPGLDHTVDLAMETKLKKTGERIVFHIEAQSSRQLHFPRRMKLYNNLCEEAFDCEVISHAICFNQDQRSIPDMVVSKNQTSSVAHSSFKYVKIDLNNYLVKDYLKVTNPFVIASLGLMDGFKNLTQREKADIKLQGYINLFSNDFEEDKNKIVAACLEKYIELEEVELSFFFKRLKNEDNKRKGLEDWVMNVSKNNAWARMIENKKTKEIIKNIINRYNETDEYVLAETANTTLDIVREAKYELELQNRPQ